MEQLLASMRSGTDEKSQGHNIGLLGEFIATNTAAPLLDYRGVNAESKAVEVTTLPMPHTLRMFIARLQTVAHWAVNQKRLELIGPLGKARPRSRCCRACAHRSSRSARDAAVAGVDFLANDAELGSAIEVRVLRAKLRVPTRSCRGAASRSAQCGPTARRTRPPSRPAGSARR